MIATVAFLCLAFSRGSESLLSHQAGVNEYEGVQYLPQRSFKKSRKLSISHLGTVDKKFHSLRRKLQDQHYRHRTHKSKSKSKVKNHYHHQHPHSYYDLSSHSHSHSQSNSHSHSTSNSHSHSTSHSHSHSHSHSNSHSHSHSFSFSSEDRFPSNQPSANTIILPNDSIPSTAPSEAPSICEGPQCERPVRPL